MIRRYADVPLCAWNVCALFPHTNARKAANVGVERLRAHKKARKPVNVVVKRPRRWPKACREIGLNDGRSAAHAALYVRLCVHSGCADDSQCSGTTHTNIHITFRVGVERPLKGRMMLHFKAADRIFQGERAFPWTKTCAEMFPNLYLSLGRLIFAF